MINPITPGSKCLLDGNIEVNVLKPSTRSKSSYTVEIPGASIQIVSIERLSALPHLSQTSKVDDIFDYDESPA